MKNTFKPIAIAISFALSSFAMAADFVPQKSTPNLEVMEVVANEAYQQPITEEYVSASDKLSQFIESKGWEEGYDATKKRIFVIQSVSFQTADPSKDNDFLSKRSMFSMRAAVEAKAEIVKYMNTEMSAVDQFTAPGTDVYAKLNDKRNVLVEKFEVKKSEMLKLLSQVNEAEADKLSGVNWEDRAEAYFDALIKKLDDSYSTDAIEQEKVDKLAQVKQEYQAVLADYKALEQQAKSINSEVTEEAYSSVSAFAKAPILGASILAQSESYDADEGEYEVAVLMVWSPKLEKGATAIITGENYKPKPKNGTTVQEWLKKQEIATMVGPRQFVDKSGERWFVGSYAMPMNVKGSKKNRNKKIADLVAKKETAMALYSDIETFEQAQILMQTSEYSDGNQSSDIAESLESNVRSVLEKRNVRGASRLLSKTVVHPISGQKIYVVAYGISGKSASEALKMEASMFKAAMKSNRVMQKDLLETKQLNQKLQKSKSVATMSTQTATTNDKTLEVKKAKKVIAVKSNKTLLNAPEIDEEDF